MERAVIEVSCCAARPACRRRGRCAACAWMATPPPIAEASCCAARPPRAGTPGPRKSTPLPCAQGCAARRAEKHLARLRARVRRQAGGTYRRRATRRAGAHRTQIGACRHLQRPPPRCTCALYPRVHAGQVHHLPKGPHVRGDARARPRVQVRARARRVTHGGADSSRGLVWLEGKMRKSRLRRALTQGSRPPSAGKSLVRGVRSLWL